MNFFLVKSVKDFKVNHIYYTHPTTDKFSGRDYFIVYKVTDNEVTYRYLTGIVHFIDQGRIERSLGRIRIAQVCGLKEIL